MTRILASSISGKKVVSADGDKLGGLKDLVTDIQTGKLLDLVVEPEMEVDRSDYENEDGYIFVPFAAVKAIKEVIIVDGESAKAD